MEKPRTERCTNWDNSIGQSKAENEAQQADSNSSHTGDTQETHFGTLSDLQVIFPSSTLLAVTFQVRFRATLLFILRRKVYGGWCRGLWQRLFFTARHVLLFPLAFLLALDPPPHTWTYPIRPI